MDALFRLMTSDTTIFDVTVHNWIIAVGGLVAIVAMVLLKDL